jgi:histidyl-tRNA synthetase
MVRGLDYYTHTVFEIVSAKLGAQDAIGAGGRYNNLVKYLGGPDIPAIGFALGLERILLALGEKTEKEELDVFVAVTSRALLVSGFKILNRLREAGFSCDFDYCAKSLKGQMRFARKRKAKLAVILGDDEAKESSLLLKDMEKSSQKKIAGDNLIAEIRKVITLPERQ